MGGTAYTYRPVATIAGPWVPPPQPRPQRPFGVIGQMLCSATYAMRLLPPVVNHHLPPDYRDRLDGLEFGKWEFVPNPAHTITPFKLELDK